MPNVNPKPPAEAAPPALSSALEKNQAVQETVEQSAQELLVINAAIKHGIPDHPQLGEVAQALEKSEAIEQRIHESAADLVQVNEALEQEINEREHLERELAQTKAKLAKATGG